MATNKGQSPQKTAPSHKGSSSYSPHPKPRAGSTTQISAGGLSKVTPDPEKGTGCTQR